MNHTVALKADGTVWTWGLNSKGQLGQGTNTNILEPTKTSITDAIDVAAGENFTAVLKRDGTVWVAGENNYGQLGQNTTTASNTFIQVKDESGTGYLTDVISISVNNGHNIAVIKNDGTVYAWGINTNGELGIGSKSKTADVKLPRRVRKITNAMELSVSGGHMLILDSDGTVWATGLGSSGQLGQNNTSASYVPIKVKNTAGTAIMQNIKAISGGASNSVLLGEDGTLYTFGYNNNGQLGTGDKTIKKLPVIAKDSEGNQIKDAVKINSRYYATSVIRADGTLWTAGQNPYGQAANGTSKANTVFTKALGERGKTELNNALLTGSTNSSIAVADTLGRVYVSGYNAYGQIGDGTINNSTYFIGISNTSLEVKDPIVVLNTIGQTSQIEAKLNLGFNILYNSLENENYTYKSMNPNIASVNTMGVITALKYGSTRIEVTNAETGNTATVLVKIVRPGDIANPTVKNGNDFTVAVKSNGTVWTWGINNFGQLGLGDDSRRLEPTQVNIQDVVDVAAGAACGSSLLSA